MADLIIPNSFVADTDASAEQVNENFDAIETAFNDSIASKLADSGTGGQIIVVANTGTPAYVAMSGDATISNTGALTLSAAGKASVGASLLAPWHTLLQVSSRYAADATAATRFFTRGVVPTFASDTFLQSAVNLDSSAHVPTIYLDDADYAVANRNTRLRVRAQVATNATAPAGNFTVGLYPVTVAGGNDSLAYTAGTVVTDSTAVATTPSASTLTNVTSAEFAVPTDGVYTLGVVSSAAIANNAAVAISAQLQVHHT